jgi:hypothetical protein
MLIVLSIGLIVPVAVAQYERDEGERDTCRIGDGDMDWLISSEADSLFTFDIWAWSDYDTLPTWGISAGFRFTINTTDFDPVRWDVYEVDSMQSGAQIYTVPPFEVSEMDSFIVFGDTVGFGPNITPTFTTRNYSQLDTTQWYEGIVESPDHDKAKFFCNFVAVTAIQISQAVMPHNQANVLCSVTVKITDPTRLPKEFTIDVDSSWYPAGGAFKFTPKGGFGYPPEFVAGHIHVSNLVLDADDAGSDDPALPRSYELGQNYPNPFNPSTTLKFYNAQKGHVNLTIYNIMGQQVRKLIDRDMDIGWQEAIWDGLDNSGEHCSSGLYFYRMDASDFSQTKKMLMVK